jgi:hypothetical protein
MTPNGDASARMEQEIMEKLMFGPSMTVEKLAKPARKVVFETGLEDDEAVSPRRRLHKIPLLRLHVM